MKKLFKNVIISLASIIVIGSGVASVSTQNFIPTTVVNTSSVNVNTGLITNALPNSPIIIRK